MSRRPTTKRGLAKDWTCTYCSFPNYSYRSTCHQCDQDSPYNTKETRKNMRHVISNSAKDAVGPNDWACDECNFTNHSWRKYCYDCKAKRAIPDKESSSVAWRAPWDWYCCMPGCEGILNFATRPTCLRCSTPFTAQSRLKAGVCGNCNEEPLIQNPLDPCGHRPLCFNCISNLPKPICPICQKLFHPPASLSDK
jgi:hypothetical protein